MAGFRQPSRQYNVTVENGARGVGNRVLLVIAFGQHRIERGDGATAADTVTGAFNQCRQLGKDRWRIALGCRRLADSQRDFTLCHRVAGEGVHDQQHVLAAVAEIFCDAGGVSCALHTQQWRDISRCGDHHRPGTPFGAEDVLDKIFDFASAFADEPDNNHVGAGIARHHPQQHALTDAGAGKQPHTLAAANGE